MTSQRTRQRLVDRIVEYGIRDQRVVEVMGRTPRHLFLDEALASRAYEDTALPIGLGQTLSQPYIVALMTQALIEQEIPRQVLEVGTGSGYQTAVLAQLVGRIYSLERIQPLLDKARERLEGLDYANVQLRYGDGTQGWSKHAPSDGIPVAAAPRELPQARLEQLARGGRLSLPVGSGGGQRRMRITHSEEGYVREVLEAVVFVPLLEGLE